jgi:endoglucanase
MAPDGSPVARYGQLQVVGTQLQDQSGKPVQLKGVSSMWLNWEKRAFAESKPALAFMRDEWKVSVIRAAMGTKEDGGYLTTPGNRKNMQTKVEKIVQNAIELGVYVIVDWHSHQATEEQADAIEFFVGMAAKYGSSPNVIWEPFNEPNKRNQVSYTWSDIKPYHEAVISAIRANDPDNLIVLGTPRWSQDVEMAALDPIVGTNLLYTLHFYACTHNVWLRNKADIALAAGLPLFITEFGITYADGGLTTSQHDVVCRAEGDAWFRWMFENNISGVAWKLEVCSDSSCLLKESAKTDGPWLDDQLSTDVGGVLMGSGNQGGHGQYVVDWLRQ